MDTHGEYKMCMIYILTTTNIIYLLPVSLSHQRFYQVKFVADYVAMIMNVSEGLKY